MRKYAGKRVAVHAAQTAGNTYQVGPFGNRSQSRVASSGNPPYPKNHQFEKTLVEMGVHNAHADTITDVEYKQILIAITRLEANYTNHANIIRRLEDEIASLKNDNYTNNDNIIRSLENEIASLKNDYLKSIHQLKSEINSLKKEVQDYTNDGGLARIKAQYAADVSRFAAVTNAERERQHAVYNAAIQARRDAKSDAKSGAKRQPKPTLKENYTDNSLLQGDDDSNGGYKKRRKSSKRKSSQKKSSKRKSSKRKSSKRKSSKRKSSKRKSSKRKPTKKRSRKTRRHRRR